MSEVRQCEITDALELVGERWSLLIIRELFWGNHRFAGIAEKTGAPRDILSARLKSLTESGLVDRLQYSERPPRWDYHLTESGRALQPVLLSLQEWSHVHRPRDPSEPAPMRFPHHDHELDPVAHFTCSVCGEAVEPEILDSETDSGS
jgi:DNA-binding HxlR family transcriptional regulator